MSLPNEVVLFTGDEADIHSIPTMAQLTSTDSSIISVNGEAEDISIDAQHAGDADLILKIAGLPVKKMNVKVLKDIKIVPGGQSIGVKLNAKGVLVVGFHLIHTKKGEKSPGEIAGIQVGDMITNINGKEIGKMTDIAPFIQSSGETGAPLKMTVLRDKKTFVTNLIPMQPSNGGAYRIGLYIRDSAAGIGTLTFIDPTTKTYGALGHVIADNDTKKPIVVEDGQVMRATVTAIQKGSNGKPGEKLASFSVNRDVIGDVATNSPFGIFGTLDTVVGNELMDKAIPIALASQVKEGPAQILTVIDEEKVEAFDVEVVSKVSQKFPATKGMVIKVTDPKLLKATGGIIQGMSGSPIIQGGKLIGAVTHVFVNDPTSGYGVHIEWMLHEAGVDIYNDSSQKVS